ncbi:hypothetical protein ACFFGV_04530 [Pontibacillus salicampi]|uniref:Transcriptional regulator n=1 Tax=Pontibacillus salicampi TaxID=1449801 RepID=A0ABV6LKG0_9BACI
MTKRKIMKDAAETNNMTPTESMKSIEYTDETMSREKSLRAANRNSKKGYQGGEDGRP